MKDVDETMQFLATCIYNLVIASPNNSAALDCDDFNRLSDIMNGYDPDVEEEA